MKPYSPDDAAKVAPLDEQDARGFDRDAYETARRERSRQWAQNGPQGDAQGSEVRGDVNTAPDAPTGQQKATTGTSDMSWWRKRSAFGR